jgi:hypothetical protein
MLIGPRYVHRRYRAEGETGNRRYQQSEGDDLRVDGDVAHLGQTLDAEESEEAQSTGSHKKRERSTDDGQDEAFR